MLAYDTRLHAEYLERTRPSADDIAADDVVVLRVRRNCSALAQTGATAVTRGFNRLRRDLESGRWHEQHADVLRHDEIDAGFRLISAAG